MTGQKIRQKSLVEALNRYEKQEEDIKPFFLRK